MCLQFNNNQICGKKKKNKKPKEKTSEHKYEG